MCHYCPKIDPTPWPCHADGTPKRLGEMTPSEQRVQWRQAAARLQKEFDGARLGLQIRKESR